MEAERTELTWSYEPADYFEVRYERDYGVWRLSVAEGHATASVAGGPPSDAVESDIAEMVKSVFRVRAVQTRKRFRLDDVAKVVEFQGGKQNTTLRVGAASIVMLSDRLDIQITDAVTGAVIRDTKAERIATEKSELDHLSEKARQNVTLRRMLESHEAAIADPANELTHLYEVRDALTNHFGSEAAAKSGVGISSSQWSIFGRLANEEPLLEGRHRGKHAHNLRHATEDELAKVRELAQEWIRTFAAAL